MRIDLHQHLLPEELLAALGRRTGSPRIVRDGRDWSLRLAGEPACTLDLRDHDPVARARVAERDEVDRVVLSISSPLGIEALPAEEAEPLLAAYNRGALELGGPFAAWGAVGLEDATPAAVDALLDAGAVGVTLPAGALVDHRGLLETAPLLDRLEARGAPLFLHPGPAPWLLPHPAEPAAPGWWPAMTGYLADMSAAWHAFAAWGRPRHPRLRVLFAVLAGGGPLHAERLVARGGPVTAIHDPLAYFDVSSYGVLALDAMLRMVGVDRLVLGSDRPVVDPPPIGQLGAAVEHALSTTNPARLLGQVAVPA